MPYADQFKERLVPLRAALGRTMAEDREDERRRKAASDQAGFWRGAGDVAAVVAPVAGLGIGALVGGPAGATVGLAGGHAAGQGLRGLAHGQAENLTEDLDRRGMKRQAALELMQQYLARG